MPGSSNNSSFIPKRGTKTSTRKIRNINIYILTIVSYVLFFAALGASAFAYFYSQNIQNQRNNEIAAMNNAVGTFKEADMQRVEEFDVRLQQAQQRLDNSASLTSILKQIESAVVESLRLKTLTIERNFDEGFIVEAEAETDTYDSAIFQRDTLTEYEVIEVVEIDDVALQQTGNSEETSTANRGQSVTLVAKLLIPLESVAYTVNLDDINPRTVIGDSDGVTNESQSEAVTTTDSSEDIDEDNLEDI